MQSEMADFAPGAAT